MKPTKHHWHHYLNLFGKLLSNRILLCDFFKVKNQKNTKMNNQHGVRLRFSNQQLTNVWKTKRIVLLLVAALSSKCQTREATTKDSVES
jgi:hypothetical protein